ncbi:MAG: hypothetical protein JRF63_12875, partial [Deltaproteobacteria bacterium]|nr:hypothetical protein [Deltaproteobacteria bacterium]
EEDLVIEGDVTVANAEDLEKIAGATRITGSLKVKRAAITSLHMPRLVEIGGRLAVQKNKTLTEVLLPALVEVGGKADHEVIIEHNFALESLVLGRLESAADGLIVRQNPKLARVELGSLSRVGRFGVELESNDGVRSLDLPALTATPRLHVVSCYRLEKLGIAALEKVGAVTIRANPSLKEIDDVPPAKVAEAARAGTAAKDAVMEVRDNFKLPTCEGTRLVDRLTERGWNGSSAVCGNLADTCSPTGCE